MPPLTLLQTPSCWTCSWATAMPCCACSARWWTSGSSSTRDSSSSGKITLSILQSGGGQNDEKLSTHLSPQVTLSNSTGFSRGKFWNWVPHTARKMGLRKYHVAVNKTWTIIFHTPVTSRHHILHFHTGLSTKYCCENLVQIFFRILQFPIRYRPLDRLISKQYNSKPGSYFCSPLYCLNLTLWSF